MLKSNENINPSLPTTHSMLFSSRAVAVKPNLDRTWEMVGVLGSALTELKKQVGQHPTKAQMSTLAYLIDVTESLNRGADAVDDLSYTPACAPVA